MSRSRTTVTRRLALARGKSGGKGMSGLRARESRRRSRAGLSCSVAREGKSISPSEKWFGPRAGWRNCRNGSCVDGPRICGSRGRETSRTEASQNGFKQGIDFRLNSYTTALNHWSNMRFPSCLENPSIVQHVPIHPFGQVIKPARRTSSHAKSTRHRQPCWYALWTVSL